MKNSYDFPVEFRSIVTHPGNLVIKNRQAVVRTDTNLPIGVVSKKYALVTHAEVVKTFRKALGKKVNENIRLTHDGARMHYEVILPDVTVKIDSGDEVAMRLVVENSYDGSHKLQIIFGAFRFVCSNGMIIGRKFLSINRRHVGEVMLNVDQVQKQVSILTEVFRKEGATMQEMASTRLIPSPEEFFNPKSLRLPAYLTKLARESYEQEGSTVWDAYNALTAVITRGMKKESPEAAISFGQHAWTGATALLK